MVLKNTSSDLKLKFAFKQKRVALLFLGFKNTDFVRTERGLRQCEHFADKGGAGGKFFVILC